MWSGIARIYRGKEIFKPLNTGRIDERVSCVREFVANIFFYTKNGVTIMIDAGYNYDRLEEKMRRRVIWGLYKLPMVHIDNPKVLLRDGQILNIEGIRIECFLVPEAPYDAYDESGDTEERARSVYLKKQERVRA